MEIFGGDAPCKYGRKDGGFLARPDPKTGTKIGKTWRQSLLRQCQARQ